MERSIPQLVGQLTLEEKAALCSGADFWHTKAVERLGIPAILAWEGAHGLCAPAAGAKPTGAGGGAVCFPAACAMAAGFDPALVRRQAEALGRQCRAAGVSVLLGPAVNLKRSPLWGRSHEAYSEDPFLAGELAAAFIAGVQSQGVGGCVRHFAACNQEYCRTTVSARMEERTLRELYLPAFERAIKKAQPWWVMCSGNRLNGTYVGEDARLLTGILRDEWGFAGAVVSGQGGVKDRVKAIAAGLELELPASGASGEAKLVAAVRDGTLPEVVLDRAVGRILNLILRAADTLALPKPAVDPAADHRLAAELEKECAVLLKNRGVLPLQAGQSVVYIGGFAQAPRIQGGGAGRVSAGAVHSALDLARRRGRRVAYVQGYPAARDEREEAEFVRAVDAAKAADAAVVFAGLPDGLECAGGDRCHMRLPECQNNLIARVAAVQPNTIVVLHCGSPVECPWAEDVAGVLCMYLGGEGVGEATDALLFGEANPCGRLPETWPLRLQDTPAYLQFPGDGSRACYTEGVFVGYRWYDAREMPVRWPFGHGLSYTGFVYRDARLSAARFAGNETVEVLVEVKNSGAMAGKETVQLYVQPVKPPFGRPLRELKGFAKVALEPGETKTVRFALDSRSLAWYDEDWGGWHAASGRYHISLGHSSRDLHAMVTVEYTGAEKEKECCHGNGLAAAQRVE